MFKVTLTDTTSRSPDLVLGEFKLVRVSHGRLECCGEILAVQGTWCGNIDKWFVHKPEHELNAWSDLLIEAVR